MVDESHTTETDDVSDTPQTDETYTTSESDEMVDGVLDVNTVESTESDESIHEQVSQGEQKVGDVTIFEGEELYHDIQPPWTAYWWDLLLGTCLLTVLIGPYWYYKAYKRRENTRYIITSDRIILKTGGISGSSTEEYRFENVDTVSTSQGFIEGMFNKGTVELTLRKKRDKKDITLDGIREYDAVKTTIRREQYNEMD